MIAAEFEYVAPSSLDEAIALLGQLGGDAKLLAGGHSLIPIMKLRLARPSHVIDLRRLSADLSYIREEDGAIAIGALATHHSLETSELLKAKLPIVSETAAVIGDVQVRNRGTIGGSLAHSDPAADYPAAILALEAQIIAKGPQGERAIAAADFFTDTFQSALLPGEILTGVRIARHGPHTGWAYAKVHHPASGYAVVGVAASLSLDEQGAIRNARVGITGLGPKAFRATAVEKKLEKKKAEAGVLQAAAAQAAKGVEPLSDLHASAEYRAHLARVHTRRALERALASAQA